MSTHPGSAAAARLRPTPAMLRGGFGSLVLAVLAVVAHRVELLVIALPLLAWTLLAVLTRMHREALETSSPALQVRSSARDVLEGGHAVVEVQAPAGLLLSVAWPPRAQMLMSPPRGAAVDTPRVRLALTLRRWGRCDVGPAHALVADPLGAHRAAYVLPAIPMQVTPASAVLDAPLEVPRPIGMSGAHLSRRRGDGTALADVRPFRAGDRLSRINWRVTSRTGTLHTTETFTEQDTDVALVLDTTIDVAAGGPEEESSLDMTVRATAAIARHYLAAGDRVAVRDLGDRIGDVRPGTGPRQLRLISTALSRARRPEGEMPRVRPPAGLRSGTLVVVCSPLLSWPVVEQIGRVLAHGADVVVVDTLPARVGSTALLHGRAPRGTDANRYWQEAWALRRLARRATLRDLRASGVPVTAWEGPASLTPVLLSLAMIAQAPRAVRR